MKYFIPFVFVMSLFQPLYSVSYVDFLDTIIDQKMVELTNSSYKVENIVHQVKKSIVIKSSLQEIKEFLDSQISRDFFCCDKKDLPLYDQGIAIATQEQSLYKELQFALGAKLYMYYLECAQQKILYQVIQNYESLNYWRNEKFYESHSFFQRKAARLLSKSNDKYVIEDNIKNLEEVAIKSDSCLGLILHCKNVLERALTHQEFKQALISSIQLQNEHLQVSDEILDLCDMSFIIKKYINELSQYSFSLLAEYTESKLPSHTVKHYEDYTLTTATASFFTCVCMYYGNTFFHNTQYFWNEHICGAIERNVNTFTGKVIGASNLDTTDNEASVCAMIKEELKNPEPLHDENSTIPEAWFGNAKTVLLGKSATSEDYAELSLQQKKELMTQRYRTISTNPERNSLRVLPLALLKAELLIIEGKDFVNNMLKDVHMTLGLTALIPVATLMSGAFFASKSVYRSMTYKPICTTLHQLEIFLNDSLYQVATFEKEGYLYFLTEQLKRHVNVLTIAEQKLMDTDITSLQSSRLDYVQKLNVVQRMYRTYPCLIPGTV